MIVQRHHKHRVKYWGTPVLDRWVEDYWAEFDSASSYFGYA
jgi:hypothetical protein